MIPWEKLASADIPGERVALRLMRRGREYSIMLGDNELMNSRLSGSEEALASLACAAIAGVREPRVLIGGLGMGFTLRAALAALPAPAHVVVAELVPEVAAWARGPMAEVFQGSLDDRRVEIRIEDVAGTIAAQSERFDAILLDVDNGPDGLTARGNDRLYDRNGLALARRALRKGGVLGVWSCDPSERFTRHLRTAGFDVEEKRVAAGRTGRGKRHVLWFATKPA